jgi:hypothetical protein
VRGADVAELVGADYEVRNGLRFVKTIRVEGLIVAQVSLPPGGGQAGMAALSPRDVRPWLHGAALGVLVLILVRFTPREGLGPAGRRAVAAGLAVLVLDGPLAAWEALAGKGDVRIDGVIDAADQLLMVRHLRGEAALTPEQQSAGDLAPYASSSGSVIGDGAVTAADVAVLARVLAGQDVDGDGLGTRMEARLDLSPFARDSDGAGTRGGFAITAAPRPPGATAASRSSR